VLTVGAAETQRGYGTGGLTSRTWGSAMPLDYSTPPIYGDYISTWADGVHQGMAAFSSRGPCNDGRIKPEIVAPGTDIVSCRSRAASDPAGASPAIPTTSSTAAPAWPRRSRRARQC